jgi:feruloyl esterase
MRTWVLATTLTLLAAPAGAATCESLAGKTLADSQIAKAETVQPFAGTDPMMGPFKVGQSFCRVSGTIAPAIQFEVWLPEAASWNGKLQGVGNGGVAGHIVPAGMAAALARGYATVSSDLGHEGGPIDFDFAIGHPELVADWGYRGTHLMTVVAKAVVEAYYGKPPRWSYFTGCSGGGRQGLMEAQRFPADYDGIVAGDPTADFTRLTLGGRLWEAIATLKDPSHYIPATKIPVIAKATVAACDALDGVKDGVIDDPRQCKFEPETIQCKSGDGPDCLTEGQVKALKAIYAGSAYGNGKQIFPGYMPGGELGPMGWERYVSGPAPKQAAQFLYSDAFARGMVMEKPSYDSLTFDYDRDMPEAIDKLSSMIDASNPDLSGFEARRGKLIQYHGWSDPGVSPLSSVNYYTAVGEHLRGDPSGFYRLFMVPGMQHCTGGPGPDHFDALAALEQWVEHAKAPDRIVATHLTDSKPDRTRPLCPYPQVAKWDGKGNTDQAESFGCVKP